MENQSPELNITHTTPAPPLGLVPQSYSTPALLQHQPSTSTAAATATIMPARNMNGTAAAAQQKTGPYLRIVEQPAKNDQRFRYVVEGRSAGSIKGVNWTAENPTYPTIEIVNYNKPVVVVVSCVTKDKPYRPHPHKVVGRDGGGQKYKNGICEVQLSEPPLRASFSNLGIQCTKKKDMEDSLKERKSIKVNPFNTKPDKDPKNDYDLHVVRLCFHAFINPTGQAFEPLEPVVTDPIIDKKAITDLVICQLCSCAAKASGGDRKILLCDKVEKNDIRVKFTEYDSQGGIKWYANVDCQPQDIHKQYAIAFYTPPYAKSDISAPVTVWIQLERPSDKSLSKPLEFQYIPNPVLDSFEAKRKRLQSPNALHEYVQNHGQFPITSSNTANPAAIGGNLYPLPPTPELKVERVTTPEYFANQNSPYSMTHSPSPQSPLAMGAMGTQYVTLTTPNHNSTNPFLSPVNDIRMPTTPSKKLPSMSGGCFTPLYADQATNYNIPTTTAAAASTVATANIYHTNQPTDSSELTSEGRLVNRLAAQLQADANNMNNNINYVSNNIGNANNVNINNVAYNYNYNVDMLPMQFNNTTQQPMAMEEDDGLTTSGLIRELAESELLQFTNLSVSGNT